MANDPVWTEEELAFALCPTWTIDEMLTRDANTFLQGNAFEARRTALKRGIPWGHVVARARDIDAVQAEAALSSVVFSTDTGQDTEIIASAQVEEPGYFDVVFGCGGDAWGMLEKLNEPLARYFNTLWLVYTELEKRGLAEAGDQICKAAGFQDVRLWRNWNDFDAISAWVDAHGGDQHSGTATDPDTLDDECPYTNVSWGVDRGSLQALINLAAAAVEKLDVVLDEALSRPA
jgi:hypothetical protein